MPHERMFNIDIHQIVSALSVSILPLLFGIICHEVAHGYMASRFGDHTARMLGRLTLNPAAHLDAMGVLFFLLTALVGPFTIGWAKPIPVNPRYFKKPVRDMALVALAGPVVNMILGFLFAFAFFAFLIIAKQTLSEPGPVFGFWTRTLQYGVYINFTLAWFNILPIPPLDGSRILMALLPTNLAWKYASLQRYGMLFMILFVALGLFRMIIGPLTYFSSGIAFGLAGSLFSLF